MIFVAGACPCDDAIPRDAVKKSPEMPDTWSVASRGASRDAQMYQEVNLGVEVSEQPSLSLSVLGELNEEVNVTDRTSNALNLHVGSVAKVATAGSSSEPVWQIANPDGTPGPYQLIRRVLDGVWILKLVEAAHVSSKHVHVWRASGCGQAVPPASGWRAYPEGRDVDIAVEAVDFAAEEAPVPPSWHVPARPKPPAKTSILSL